MSQYDVTTPGFLDLNASKRANGQTRERANEQARAPEQSASKPAPKASKPAPKPAKTSKRSTSGKRRAQLSLNGFCRDLHKRLTIAAAERDVSMVALSEEIIGAWLEQNA
jgi:activator of HSP90 ATPase